MGKKMGKLAGWVLVVIGVLGFFGNPLVGSSGAMFLSDTNGNLVHIVTGAILLWVAYKSESKTDKALKVLGVIYVVMAVLGFWMSGRDLLGLMAVNSADNWLHLVLGVAMLWGAKARGSLAMA